MYTEIHSKNNIGKIKYLPAYKISIIRLFSQLFKFHFKIQKFCLVLSASRNFLNPKK